MSVRSSICVTTILPLLLAVSAPAHATDVLPAAAAAHETDAPPAPAPTTDAPSAAPAPAPKKWEFATIGYVFFAGAYGTTTPRDPLSPVDLHLTFGDVMKSFKFAFMGAAEARKDRLVFLGDLMWVHLGEGKGLTASDRNFADVKIDSKTTAITALAGYRVVNHPSVTVDVLAGGRLNGNKQAVDYRGTPLDVSAKVSKTWVDPVLATRIRAPLGGKFGLALYGDVGGFGIGSKLTWQGMATADYRISHEMSAGLGWRYFKINYHDSDGFRYNVAQSGPIVTLRTVL